MPPETPGIFWRLIGKNKARKKGKKWEMLRKNEKITPGKSGKVTSRREKIGKSDFAPLQKNFPVTPLNHGYGKTLEIPNMNPMVG